ncbi:tRNA (5-methylaminomethyl-2-thiouridylate)-methyltransferase, partial [Chlamydia psittaci 06-1683]
QFRGRYHRL